MPAPTLGPPPLDTPTGGRDGIFSVPWSKWLRQIWDTVRGASDLDVNLGTVANTLGAQELQNKSIDGTENTLTNINLSSVLVPRARCTSSASTSIPNGSDTLVDFGNVVFDSHSAVTTGASWKFTVPTGHGGTYRVDASVMFAVGAATDGQMAIFKNGVHYTYMSGRRPLGASFSSIGGTDLIQLAAGDYVDVRVAQFSGGARALWGDSVFTHISIERVA